MSRVRGSAAGQGDMLGAGQLPNLGEPDVVAGGIAERRVDAVRTLLRLLDELHTAGAELLVGGAAVIGDEEDRPGETLAHQGAYLLGGVGVHHRPPGGRSVPDRGWGRRGWGTRRRSAGRPRRRCRRPSRRSSAAAPRPAPTGGPAGRRAAARRTRGGTRG